MNMGKPKRILYVYAGAGSPVTLCERRLVDRLNNDDCGLAVDFWNWTSELSLDRNPTLEWARLNQDLLGGFYQQLARRSRGADLVLISQTGGILPEVMADLPATVIYNTADDPDSSATCSFPFLTSADVIAHAGVNFDAKRTMGEVFLERGAKRCVHFPLGFYEEEFPAVEDFDAQFAARDIDLVYLGHLKRGKLEPLMRRFDGMLVHSRSLKLKHKLYVLAKTGKWVRPFTGDVASLYRRCKIGVNMHFTFGPSNARCYQLCACGAAQVVDCREGIAALYRPEEEVLTYAAAEEAAGCIEWLLADEQLRYRVSRAGYERARKNYNRREILAKLLLSV